MASASSLFFLPPCAKTRGVRRPIFWSSPIDILSPSERVWGAAVNLLWLSALEGLVASDQGDLPDSEYVVSLFTPCQDARGAAVSLLLAVHGRSASFFGR